MIPSRSRPGAAGWDFFGAAPDARHRFLAVQIAIFFKAADATDRVQPVLQGVDDLDQMLEQMLSRFIERREFGERVPLVAGGASWIWAGTTKLT